MQDLIKKLADHDWKKELTEVRTVGKWLLDRIATRGLLSVRDQLKRERRMNRFEQVLKATKTDIKKLFEEKILVEDFDRAEIKEFVIRTFAEASELRNVRKAVYFRSAFIGGIVRNDIDIRKKNHFVQCLSSLSEASIDVLASLYKYIQQREPQGKHFNLSSVKDATGIDDSEFLVALLRELNHFNLVELSWSMARQPTDLQSNTAFYVLGLFEEFCRFITEYGGEEQAAVLESTTACGRGGMPRPRATQVSMDVAPAFARGESAPGGEGRHVIRRGCPVE